MTNVLEKKVGENGKLESVLVRRREKGQPEMRGKSETENRKEVDGTVRREYGGIETKKDMGIWKK